MRIQAGTPLLVKDNGKRYHAQCCRVYKNSLKAKLSNGKIVTVTQDRAQLAKKKSLKRVHVPKTDVQCTTKRLGRYRKVHIVPTRYHPSNVLGNFGAMLNEKKYTDSGVCMFNDNTGQFEFFGLNPSVRQAAGGGNAIARIMQHLKHSIGMPTGPFRDLMQVVQIRLSWDDTVAQHTAKEVIDHAVTRIVRLFLDNDAKDTLYYSINPNDPEDSRRLGLSIFAGAVGDDVVDYISDEIHKIPALVQKARVSGVRP